jgi:sarcosine oxidase subunit beta
MIHNYDQTLDVAVVGAGITGLSTGLNLARRGVERIAVFDRAGVGAGASGIQPGGVRRQWGTRLNCLLSTESYAFFRDLDAQLGIADAPVLEPCGYVFVADTDVTLERMRRDVELQRSLGIPSQLLSPDELTDVVPGFGVDGAIGAAYCREDAYFDRPQRVVELFAQAAEREGVTIEQRGVEAIRRDGDRWRLTFTDGTQASADTIVVAAGEQSRALLAPLEIELPIVAQAKYLFLSEPVTERLLEPLVVLVDRHFAAKHLASGRVLASDLTAAGDPDADAQAWRSHIRACIDQALPLLTFVSFGIVAEGAYDMTPDHQPIVCPVGEAGGLWVAAGFSGHGFMMAPAVGRMVAEAIAEGRRDPLLDQLELRRFDAGEVEAELAVV